MGARLWPYHFLMVGNRSGAAESMACTAWNCFTLLAMRRAMGVATISCGFRGRMRRNSSIRPLSKVASTCSQVAVSYVWNTALGNEVCYLSLWGRGRGGGHLFSPL